MNGFSLEKKIIMQVSDVFFTYSRDNSLSINAGNASQ